MKTKTTDLRAAVARAAEASEAAVLEILGAHRKSCGDRVIEKLTCELILPIIRESRNVAQALRRLENAL
mgnify:FL=1